MLSIFLYPKSFSLKEFLLLHQKSLNIERYLQTSGKKKTAGRITKR